jgi:hypothetical protein
MEIEAQLKRLGKSDEMNAINEFVWHMLGTDCSDESFDDFVVGCRIVYRDDYDTGKSYYIVCDRDGNGDGSGEWSEVV